MAKEARGERYRASQPDPDLLDWLADWFDRNKEAVKGSDTAIAVQADLRRLAKNARAVLSEPEK